MIFFRRIISWWLLRNAFGNLKKLIFNIAFTCSFLLLRRFLAAESILISSRIIKFKGITTTSSQFEASCVTTSGLKSHECRAEWLTYFTLLLQPPLMSWVLGSSTASMGVSKRIEQCGMCLREHAETVFYMYASNSVTLMKAIRYD